MLKFKNKFNYIDSNNIHRIFLNYYMDKNNINSMTFDELKLIDNFSMFEDMYSMIIFGGEYKIKGLGNISLREFKQGFEDKNLTDKYNLFSKHIPIELLDFMHIKQNNNLYNDIVQNKRIGLSNIQNYRNYRDSVLFFNDLEKLNFNISKIYSDFVEKDTVKIIKDSDVYYNKQKMLYLLRNLFTMQFRLIIPKYLYDKICNCTNITHLSNKIKYCLYRSEYGNIQFLHTINNNIKYKEIDEQIRFITKDGNENLDALPGTVLYDVYFNLNFEEINDLINVISPYEEYYNGQVIGAIYYNLINYYGIKLLFNIEPSIEEGINRRIHRRFSN